MTHYPILKTLMLFASSQNGYSSLWQLSRRIIAVALYVSTSNFLYSEDIRSDLFSPSNEIIIDAGSLSPLEQRKAVAMTAFARFFMRPSAEQLKKSLYTVLENDPEAKTPLKIALFSLSKTSNSDVDELLTRMISIAKRNPRALPINLAIIAFLCEKNKFIRAGKIAQNCLDAVDCSEKITETDLNLYVNIIALRGVIYEKTVSFDRGEDFFDSLLANEQLRDNFTVMKSAVLSFSAAAKKSSSKASFLFWKSDRARLDEKTTSILERMSAIIDKSGQSEQIGELAGIYEKLNMPERAESILIDYLILHSDNEHVVLVLAKMLTRNKDSRALFYWKALLKFNPDNLMYLREAGEAAWREEYKNESINYFQLYLKKRPEYSSIGLRLAMMQMELGKFDQALAILKKQKKSFYILQGIGVVKLHRSDYQGAMASFNAAAALLPAEKQSLFLCLNILVTADYCGKVETVRKYSGIITRNFPDKVADYGNALGYTLTNNNIELELADKLLSQALKIAPGKLEILDSMAWLLYREKHYNQALKYIKLSLKACGEYPHAVIAAHAGDIYLALGDRANAIKYWEIALEVYGIDLDRTAVRNKISQYTNHNK
jgi:tetratricopeptide (TPR) repeat protein